MLQGGMPCQAAGLTGGAQAQATKEQKRRDWLSTGYQLIQQSHAAKRGGEGAWHVQVLVVAPSQELAMQIVRVATALLPKT